MKIKSLNLKVKSYSSKFKVIFKKIALLFLIVTLHFALCTLQLSKANAASSSNQNYDLQIQDIDTPHEKVIETPRTLGADTSQPLPTVIRETAPMSFYLSTTLIDFGPLSPNNPTIRSGTLSIISANSDYVIQSSEDHQLKNKDNSIIADTTCDNGACTELDEALWTSNLTYGFGLRCDNLNGYGCIESTDPNYYKQFTNSAGHEIAQNMISGTRSTAETKAQITLKLNTSGTQKPGNYSNTLTFIAVPNY